MEVINNVKLSLGFNLRQPKKVETQTVIYCVVKINSKQIKLPINCKVYSYQWNNKQQMCSVKPNMIDNDRINNIEANKKILGIKNSYLELINYLCGEYMTDSQIKDTIKSQINEIVMANTDNLRKEVVRTKKATTILDKALKIYTEEIKKVSEGTLKTYTYQLKRFKDYCKEVGKDKESMLTQKGINDYQAYLERLDDRPSNKQINNYVKILCTLINNVITVHNAFIKEQKTIRPVKPMRLQEIKVTDIEDKKRRPLTSEELDKIINCELDNKLSEYRDLFVMQCNCGYRVSDSAIIWNSDNYKYTKINGNEYIEIVPKKEKNKGVKAIIWINDRVKGILDKYKNGFKYVDFDNKFDDNLNKYIKQIAKIAGLDSKESWINAKGDKCEDYLYNIIASHFARYTFVNNCFEMGMSAEEIMKFSGHKEKSMITEVYGLRNQEQRFKEADKVINRINKPVAKKAEPVTTNINLFSVGKYANLLDEFKMCLYEYMGADKTVYDLDSFEMLFRYSINHCQDFYKKYRINAVLFNKEYSKTKDIVTKYEKADKFIKLLKTTIGII